MYLVSTYIYWALRALPGVCVKKYSNIFNSKWSLQTPIGDFRILHATDVLTRRYHSGMQVVIARVDRKLVANTYLPTYLGN